MPHPDQATHRVTIEMTPDELTALFYVKNLAEIYGNIQGDRDDIQSACDEAKAILDRAEWHRVE